ncbi:PrsW family glutamic-type intramembrane protease [Thermoflexus hugenholtzii]
MSIPPILEGPSEEIPSLEVREEVAERSSPTGALWVAAGLLTGMALSGLWLGLAALAALLSAPMPPPGLLLLGLLMGIGLFQEGIRITRGIPDALLPVPTPAAQVRMLSFLLILIGCGAVVERLAPDLPIVLLPLHAGIAVLGPLWWFNLLRQRLAASWSRRRTWWGLGLGGLAAPGLALLLEGVALVGLGLGLLIARLVVEGPDFIRRWFPMGFPPGAPPVVPTERLLGDPWVWAALLIGGAGLVPLIEELVKPLPAFLRARAPTAEGILYGALGGAGFAIAENLLNWTLGAPWALTALGRLGASALHVFNSALMGWAWGMLRQGRPGAGLGAYLLVVLLHSLWNAGALLLGIGFLTPLPDRVRVLIAPPVLIGMGAVGLAVLIGLGWALPALAGGEDPVEPSAWGSSQGG